MLQRFDCDQLLYAPCQDKFAKSFSLPIPCILKPKRLWSGKQVVRFSLHIERSDVSFARACAALQISSILAIVGSMTETPRPAFNLDSKSKLGNSLWGKLAIEDGDVIIRGGELLVGVLDKSQVRLRSAVFVRCEAANGAVIPVWRAIVRSRAHGVRALGTRCRWYDSVTRSRER